MRHSFLACLLLCFSISFAQLSVQNDAYVFVNNEQLFVTDYVNIDDANSKIYLRNEAQLLQDFTATTSSNSGSGQLSVYQTGTANTYAYNYWCSPVGNNSVTVGNEDGRVDLLKYANNIPSAGDPTGTTSFTDAIFTTGYDGSASPLTISSSWLYTYATSSTYASWNLVGSAGAINPGLGFTMKGNPTSSQIYDFRGKPNNGTITNTVTNGEFTLVGNPYPSALDAQLYINDPVNQAAITGTLFYWEQNGTASSHVLVNYNGGYAEYTIDNFGVETFTPAHFATYDAAGNVFFVPPGPPGGTKTARRYIPIGQGFMVEGIANGVVSAKNEHRVFEKVGAQSYFFRNNTTDTEIPGMQYQENGLSIVPEDYKRFRINVDFTAGNTQFTRQVVLNFSDRATAGFDYGMELSRSENSPTDAYFTFDGKAYSAQAFPFETALTIPLIIDIEQQQPLTFRIFDIQNFDDTQGIYIHDIENEVYVDLRNQNYEINIEPGNYTDRFEIVFTPQASLGIDDFDVTSLKIQQNNKEHQLSVYNPNGLDIKTIEVYDVAGKRMIQVHFDVVEDIYDLPTLHLSDGVYVVNVKSNTHNMVKSQKVIIKN